MVVSTTSVVAVTGMSVGVVGTSVTVIGLEDVVELEAVVVLMVEGSSVVSFLVLILTMNEDGRLIFTSSQSTSCG